MTGQEPIEDDRLPAQYDGIPVPCYTWRRVGAELVLERANHAAVEFSEGAIGNLIGRTASDLYAERPAILADFERCWTERRTVRREMEHTRPVSGARRRLDVSYVFIAPDRVLVHADDVTEVRESEERLRAVIATLESGVVTLDVDGKVRDVNPAALSILGITREMIATDPAWWSRLPLRPEDGGDSPACRALRAGEPARDVRMVIARPDGDEATVSVNYQPLQRDGTVHGLVISIVDLTERLRLHDRLVHQALHDPLTGLPNRILFQERLEQALSRAQRERVATVLLGLDRFKAVNDAAGHAAGDRALEQVAERLQEALDVDEPLARFGGDEFAVLAELADEREAVALGQRIRDALEAPLEGLFLSASIGIAVEGEGRRTAAALIQGADAAMHRAKARGGGAYEIFDRDMRGRLRDRLRIEDGLRRALERDELRLHYQPIVRPDSRRVVAVEALVRWQHTEEGLLAPGRFLPVAEQHGRLISLIGDWVLRRACADLPRWPEDLYVSVNVSARELSEPDFAARVERTLDAAGVPPHRIALEITETTLMEGGDASIAGLEDLAALGLALYLDDFGTGYSSLTRLARLPLTGIKLDRGFVARATDERERRIVEAALSMGHAAELAVVAEGVETVEQLTLLHASGCELVQGYLLGRPQALEQVAARLT